MKSFFIILLFLPLMLICQIVKPVHFKFKDNTGINAAIAITTAASPNVNGVTLEIGDEIGVFSTKDSCCGASVWQNINTSVIAQGDDGMTSQIDGFLEGELMAFKIWVKKSNKEYKTRVQYSAVSPFLTNFFHTNGIYYLTSISGYTTVKVEENILPNQIIIHQNYPNPFNPSTKIYIYIPQRNHVTLDVIDINGKIVKNLNNSILELGDHTFEWNGINNDSKKTASGIYFYKAVIDNKIYSGKMILSK